MGWLRTARVRRHQKRYRTTGHGWQRRFKAFPAQGDERSYAVCRYVEPNALRANLVARAQDWRWSSLWHRVHPSAGLLLGPLARGLAGDVAGAD